MRAYATGLSLTLGVGLVAYPMLKVDEPAGIIAIGAAGVVFLTLSLTWRRARALSVIAVILVALHYAVALHTAQVGLDVYSVLVAVGVFFLHETTDMSNALADTAPMARTTVMRRVAITTSMAAAGALLAVLGIFARSLFTAGVTGLAIGTLCALGVVSVPLLLARRT